MPISFYAVVLLSFIGIYSWHRVEDGNEQKPFVTLVFLSAMMIIVDSLSRMYTYSWFPLWLAVATTYANFALHPIFGIAWYRFVRSVLTADERSGARGFDMAVNIITAIGLVVLVVNPFTGVVFSFDDTGTYFRGSLFFFPAGATFLCIVLSEVFLSFRTRSLGNSVFVSMLIFPVPPLLGGIIAMFVYGVAWMPLGIAFSMVVLFATRQMATLGRDFLTGLSNRRKFDELLSERCAWAERGHKFSGIMIDLDEFKSINDTLGHAMGDIALAEAAKVIKGCVRSNDVVARLGGDEFMVLIEDADAEVAAKVSKRIEDAAEAFNAGNHRFKLLLSMGYDEYDAEKYETGDNFMTHLDALMYANKADRKLARRLQTAS